MGWKDPHCMTPCNGNSYGANCSQTCGMCLIVNFEFLRCNRETGVCDGGCQPGWQGEKCQTQCPNGTYGMNCSSQCSCPGEARCTCDPQTGECTSGLCAVQSLASEVKSKVVRACVRVCAVGVGVGGVMKDLTSQGTKYLKRVTKKYHKDADHLGVWCVLSFNFLVNKKSLQG